MSVTIELALEIERITRAKAEAQGLSLEEYLSELVTRAMQQEEWDTPAASSAPA